MKIIRRMIVESNDERVKSQFPRDHAISTNSTALQRCSSRILFAEIGHFLAAGSVCSARARRRWSVARENPISTELTGLI